MECPNCHATLTDDVRVCPACGAAVESTLPVEESGSGEVNAADASALTEEGDAADEDDATDAAAKDGAAEEDDAEEDEARTNSSSPDESDMWFEDRWPEYYTWNTPESRQARRKRNIAITAAVVVLASFAVFGFINLVFQRRVMTYDAAVEEALQTKVPFEVDLQVSDYDASRTTPVPVRVTGTTKTGESVDEVQLLVPDQPFLQLLPGSYEVGLEGGPVSNAGTLYSASVDRFSIEVVEQVQGTVPDGRVVAEQTDTQMPLLICRPIPPQDVRDEEIEAARAWMLAAGIAGAQEFADSVIIRRQQVLEQLAAEQQQREEAEREAREQEEKKLEDALKARKKTSNEYFSFELPASWEGKVEVTSTYDAQGFPLVSIHLPEDADAELARITVESGRGSTSTDDDEDADDENTDDEDMAVDDEDEADEDEDDGYGTSASANGSSNSRRADKNLSHVVVSRALSDGVHHVEVKTTNWPLIASNGSYAYTMSLTDDQLDTLVKLSTGGAFGLKDVEGGAFTDDDIAVAEKDFSQVAFSSLEAS